MHSRIFSIFVVLFFASISYVQGNTIQPTPSSWKNFRQGQQNLGRTNVKLADSPATAPWFFQTEGLIWSTPVSDEDGMIYVGAADKNFYALTPEGKLKWKYKIFDKADSLIDSAAVITSQGLIAIPGGDGYIHAVDKKTGASRWAFQATGVDEKMHMSGIVVNSFEGNVTEGPNGILYAGSDNGYMYALEQATGKKLWELETKMMIWSSPGFHSSEGWMVFGSLDHHLYLVNAQDGKLLDKMKLEGDVKASPAVDGNTVYVGSAGGKFYSIAVKGGKLVKNWQITTGDEIYSSAAVGDDAVYVGCANGIFYAFTKDGKSKWTYNTHSRILSSPVLTDDGWVLFGAKNGKIYSLSAQNGERIWSYATTESRIKSNLDSSISISNKGLISVGSYDGRVISLGGSYCLKNKDPNCEYGGKFDLPDFGTTPPANGVVLAFEERNGRWSKSKPDAISLSSVIRIKLLAFENSDWVENAAINPLSLKLEVEPKTDVEFKVSGDGRSLALHPVSFWQPNTEYKIKVSGSYFHQTHWFWDRFKWFGTRFSSELTFKTEAAGTPSLAEGDKFGIDSLFLFHPQALETYLPAAIDGQVFSQTVFGVSEDGSRFLVAAVPVTKESANKVKVLPEPARAFFLIGQQQAGNIALRGAFKISAMGGEIPFKKSFYSAQLASNKLPQKGEFMLEGPCWEIKGSGADFQFPLQLADWICDHKLHFISFGKFESFPVEKASDTSLSATVKSEAGQLAIKLARTEAKEPRLVMAALVDKTSGSLLGQEIRRIEENQKDLEVKLPGDLQSARLYLFENGNQLLFK